MTKEMLRHKCNKKAAIADSQNGNVLDYED